MGFGLVVCRADECHFTDFMLFTVISYDRTGFSLENGLVFSVFESKATGLLGCDSILTKVRLEASVSMLRGTSYGGTWRKAFTNAVLREVTVAFICGSPALLIFSLAFVSGMVR